MIEILSANQVIQKLNEVRSKPLFDELFTEKERVALNQAISILVKIQEDDQNFSQPLSIKRSEIDSVNSPNHYTAGGIETIDFIKAKMSSEEFEGYCTGNILKYMSRYKFKNGVEDLRKAARYLEWMIESMED